MSEEVAATGGEHPFSVPGAESSAEPILGPASLRHEETKASAWDLCKFLDGIDDPQHAPTAIIAGLLSKARPADSFNDDFAWCQHLSRDSSKLKQVLSQPALVEKLVDSLGHQMSRLVEQEAATAAELNEKFCTNSTHTLGFGDRSLFDDGLAAWIGVPNSTDPMLEVPRLSASLAEFDFSARRKMSFRRVCARA